VPCPVPVRSRPDCSGIRRIPRRAASPSDDAAQAGRNPVAFFDVAIEVHFGIAESHTGFVLANGPLILTPRVVFFRTPSVASTARWSPEPSKLDSRGNPADSSPCGFECRTQARLYSFGWVPLEQPVDEPDGHPSSLRPSWPMGGESSLSGAEVLARVGRFDGIAFHRSSS
jgi:hypothetical protein